MGKFYVYEHWRPDKKVCFWVGKGKGRRAFYFRRNSHYNRIITKLSRLGMCAEVKMIANSLTEQDAHKLECERITWWRSKGNELANKTDGGEGVSGLMHSNKSKLLMRNQKLGKHLTKEHRIKISAGNKGKILSKLTRSRIAIAHTGKKQRPHTKEHREKIAVANRGKKMSAEARENISRSHTGKSLSRRHRKSISDTVKELWNQGDYREKVMLAHASRPPISDETRAKMIAAQRARGSQRPASHRARISASIKAWHAKRKEQTNAAIQPEAP